MKGRLITLIDILIQPLGYKLCSDVSSSIPLIEHLASMLEALGSFPNIKKYEIKCPETIFFYTKSLIYP